MGSITFIDSMKAWENAMHNGDSSDLEELLLMTLHGRILQWMGVVLRTKQ